jgi:exodeoxyribonuclease VII large subunit
MGSRFQHIGIITSATGAAIRDITSVFNRRFPATRLTLFPVAVQGKDAPGEIVGAISLANRLRDKLQLQALILGRGGGSLEDLQAFNEESVARAVFASELPITSAVGHEVDFTISDFAADLRAPTPSAAAELMSPDQSEYQQLLLGLKQQFRNSLGISIRQRYQSLDWLQKRMKRPDRRLQEHAQTLDRLDIQLQRSMRSGLREKKVKLDSQRRALLSANPHMRLQTSEQRLKSLQQRMAQSLKSRLNQGQTQLQATRRNLNAVSPLAVLSRGYSISYNEEGQVLRSASQLTTGSKLVTRLAGANVDSKVTRVEVVENGAKDNR